MIEQHISQTNKTNKKYRKIKYISNNIYFLLYYNDAVKISL